MMLPRPLSALLLAFAFAAPALADPLADGDAAYARADYTTAAACYSAAAADRPSLKQDAAFLAKQNRAKAGACCEAAERLIINGSGAMALGQLDEAERLDPAWDRPRQLRAKVVNVAGDEAWRRCLAAAIQGDSTLAMAQLADALQHNPDHPHAKPLQLLMKAGPSAGSDWASAEALAKANDWTAADAAYARVIKDNPEHVPALLGRQHVLAKMAASMATLNQSRLQLLDAKLDVALASLDKAMTAWPKIPGGAELLADAKGRRQKADALLTSGTQLLGQEKAIEAADAFRAALALDKASILGKNGLAEAVTYRVQTLKKTGRPGAALAAAWPDRGLSPTLTGLAQALTRELQAANLPKIIVQGNDARLPALAQRLEGALPSQPAAGSPWTLTVAVAQWDSDLKKTASEEKIWTWNTTQEVPNPEYDATLAKLERARLGLCQAQANLNAHRAGDGHPLGCKCADCCCASAANQQVIMWQNEVAQMQALLNRTPRMTQIVTPHTAKYTDETWTATGQLALTLTTPEGEIFKVEQSVARSDRKRIGALPQNGLPEDPLALPSMDQLGTELLGAAAKDAAKTIQNQAVQSRIVALRHTAVDLERQGQADLALEQRMAAAALLCTLSEANGHKALADPRGP